MGCRRLRAGLLRVRPVVGDRAHLRHRARGDLVLLVLRRDRHPRRRRGLRPGCRRLRLLQHQHRPDHRDHRPDRRRDLRHRHVRARRAGPAGDGLLGLQRGGCRRQRRPAVPGPDQAPRPPGRHLRRPVHQRHPGDGHLARARSGRPVLADARRRPDDHLDRSEQHTSTEPMEPRSLVAAIDQGTTSSRCILFDRSGRPVASHQLGHAQITPRPGWVEHDADEILERVRTCVRVALRDVGADAGALAAVGISDQRETTVVWSRTTGRPVEHAIVWQDTRTADAGARLAAGRSARDGSLPGADRAADLDLFVGAQARLDARGGRAGRGDRRPRPATCCSARSTAGSSGT